MVGHYMTMVLRLFWQHKAFSLINIVGLATAFSAAIIIAIFVRSESGWDSFWPEVERTYRLESTYYFPDRPPSSTSKNSAVAVDSLKEWFPEIETTAAMWTSRPPVRVGENLYRELIAYAEPGFLEMFALDFVAGGGEDALDEMSTIVISETMARKYFGGESALDKLITISNAREYRVTGVYKDLPEASHLELNMVARLNRGRLGDWFKRWFWTNVYVYVRLKPGLEIEDLSARLPEFINHFHEAQVANMGLDIKPSELSTYRFVPVRDIHLTSNPDSTIKPLGSQTLLTGLSIVGLFILIIAAINFINLSTARASLRAREVGIRKMSGASRIQLASQFVGEAIFLTFFSLVIGIVLVEMMLPFVSDLVGMELDIALIYSTPGLLALVVGGLGIGFLSGFYPALMLSGARPAEVLFSNHSLAGPKAFFRNALVVAQFAVATGMILATLVLFSQTQYASDFDLGFTKEKKLVLIGSGHPDVVTVHDALVRTLMNNAATKGVTFSDSTPGDDQQWGEFIYKTGVANPTPIGISVQPTSPNYLEVYGARLLAGRLLSEDRALDVMRRADAEDWESQGNVVINETAARLIGHSSPGDAIGELLKIDLSSKSAEKEITVVGVVKDLHFKSLHQQIRPSIFLVDEQTFSKMTISYDTDAVSNYLAFVDRTWEELVPTRPIGRSFLDENLDALYINEARAYKLFVAGSFLALLISSLGLYGLALFSTARRTKEISVRKVHGAGIFDIVKLLVWQFTLPVILANFLALPLTGWLMLEWLQSFTYRIELGPAPFVLASLFALLIAWSTVGGHAFKAARNKPAENLHYE